MRWTRDETVEGRLRALRGSADLGRRQALVDSLVEARADTAQIVAAIARTADGDDPWQSVDAEDVMQFLMHRLDLQRAAIILATRHAEVRDPLNRGLCVTAAKVLLVVHADDLDGEALTSLRQMAIAALSDPAKNVRYAGCDAVADGRIPTPSRV